MVVGALSSLYLLYAPKVFGLPGVWAGLALFMSLRMTAGFMRLGSRAGPWWFLHQKEPRYKLVKNIASVFQCLLLIHVAIVFVVILASLALQMVGWGCEDIKCSTVLCRLHSRNVDSRS